MHPSLTLFALWFLGEGNAPKSVQVAAQVLGVAAVALLFVCQA